MKIYIFIGVIILSAILTLPAYAKITKVAAEEDVDSRPFHTQTLQGAVAGKTSRNLSLQYKQEGNNFFEMVVPFDEKMTLVGYKNIKEIKVGDEIRVDLKDFYSTDENNQEIRTDRAATKITLVKNSTKGKLISRD